MAFVPQEFRIGFDEDGDPVDVVMEGLLTANGGPATNQRCVYTLTSADTAAVSALVANAQAACGF